MSGNEYDIVIVGGGLAGTAFAVVMGKAGARVLVVERETHFQDRIRGEFMEPWGVAETRRLGIYDAIRNAANDNPFWQLYISGMKLDRRDIVATTPHNSPNLAIYHPARGRRDLQKRLVPPVRRADRMHADNFQLGLCVQDRAIE
jgi:menaquinone-9 beta-reductase